MQEKSKQLHTRRDFLRMMGASGAVIALAACTPPAPPSAGPAAAAGGAASSGQAFLNYWTGWSGFEFDELQRQVDKFNEANKDKIFVNMTTVFGQYDKVLTAIAGGNPPDDFPRSIEPRVGWKRMPTSVAPRISAASRSPPAFGNT